MLPSPKFTRTTSITPYIYLFFGSDRLPNLFHHLMGDSTENSCKMVGEVMPIADSLQFGRLTASIGILLTR
jgi:hypothetical protein